MRENPLGPHNNYANGQFAGNITNTKKNFLVCCKLQRLKVINEVLSITGAIGGIYFFLFLAFSVFFFEKNTETRKRLNRKLADCKINGKNE